MQFAKHLRPKIKSGEVTTSIRIWKSARVKADGCYRLEDGFVVVDEIRQIELSHVTPGMARPDAGALRPRPKFRLAH